MEIFQLRERVLFMLKIEETIVVISRYIVIDRCLCFFFFSLGTKQ